jgi:hypothetical protein
MKITSILLLLAILVTSCERKKIIRSGEVEADAPTFNAEIVRLSDINFPDQQYAIDFLLYIDYPDSTTGIPFIDYEHLIRIRNTKRKPDISFYYLGQDTVHHEKNLALEVNALMDKSWNVTGYPFDDQTIGVDIYLSDYDSSQLLFHTDKAPILFQDPDNFENGWSPDTMYWSKSIRFNKFDKKAKSHSVFSFQVPVYRTHPGFIFWKLFAGMYIAFFVSFVALFINIEHVEPRFGLPVGGLFATIANKYIIEGLLPLTPKLSLVDWLHDITIFSIFLIISFSAVALRLYDMEEKSIAHFSAMRLGPLVFRGAWKKRWMTSINQINPWLFFGMYIVVNIVIVLFNIS